MGRTVKHPAVILSLLLVSLPVRAAAPAADISITFAPKQGEAITATAPGAWLDGVTLPLDVPNAVRIVEVAPLYDDEGKSIAGLHISILDPGTILPATPGLSYPGGSTGPVPPKPLALLQTTVRFQLDRDIVFFQSPAGDWSIKVKNLVRP